MASDLNTKIFKLKEKVAKFRDERNWKKYHNPKNLVMAITIEAAELMELFTWKTPKESERLVKNKKELQKIKEELADILIYSLAFADRLGIDISQAILQKLKKNKKRFPKDKLPVI